MRTERTRALNGDLWEFRDSDFEWLFRNVSKETGWEQLKREEVLEIFGTTKFILEPIVTDSTVKAMDEDLLQFLGSQGLPEEEWNYEKTIFEQVLILKQSIADALSQGEQQYGMPEAEAKHFRERRVFSILREGLEQAFKEKGEKQ